jgi:hypothetical protein
MTTSNDNALVGKRVRLRIPTEFHEGLLLLFRLTDAQTDELVHALERAPLRFSSVQLASELASQISSISPSNLTQLTEALLATYVVFTTSDVDVNMFVDDLYESVLQQVKSPPESDTGVKSRLLRLYGIDRLAVSTKAKLIVTEHQHSFCNARLFTDIRPIFGQDATAQPSGAMLVHTLKLHYHEGTEFKEFFVALDSDDLENLRSILKRASEKAESLKDFIKSTSITYVDVTE